MKKDLRFWVYGALLTALVVIGTMVINIPTVATQGYVNLGDGFIILSAYLFGPAMGFIAGGIGSALADVLKGYAVWAPWSLIIKGLMGMIVGYLTLNPRKGVIKKVLIFAAAEIWMVLGYFMASLIMFGYAAALADVPSNMVQGAVGVVVGVLLSETLKSIDLSKRG